jgi:hypothetical protein
LSNPFRNQSTATFSFPFEAEFQDWPLLLIKQMPSYVVEKKRVPGLAFYDVGTQRSRYCMFFYFQSVETGGSLLHVALQTESAADAARVIKSMF